jgi:hypothetical protein
MKIRSQAPETCSAKYLKYFENYPVKQEILEKYFILELRF